jgi:hypothetical protein
MFPVLRYNAAAGDPANSGRDVSYPRQNGLQFAGIGQLAGSNRR